MTLTTLEPTRTTVRPATVVVRGVSLLFTGLFSGFLLAVLVLENSLRAYGSATYTQVRLVELDSLDKLASATLIPALVSTLIITVIRMRAKGNDRWLGLAAVVLLVVVFAVTLAVNLPINADQVDWSVQSPPSDWASVRDRWQIAHLIRTVVAISAFACLIAGALSRNHER